MSFHLTKHLQTRQVGKNFCFRIFSSSFLNSFKTVHEYAVRNGILGVSSFNHKNSTEYSVFKHSLHIRWFHSLVCAPMKSHHFRALFSVVKAGDDFKSWNSQAVK